MLDAREFADAIRRGVARSGLAEGKAVGEAGYVSLAGTVLEYLKANLEVTVPAEALNGLASDPAAPVRCTVR